MSDPLPRFLVMMGSADTELAARIRAGDTAAFTELVDAHAGAALRLAHRLLGSRDAAVDVIQTVLADWWTRRETFTPYHSIRAYFLGAIRLQALKELRRDARWSRHLPPDEGRDASRDTVRNDQIEAPVAARESNDPESVLYDHLTVQALLAKLSDRRRTALQLRYLEQLSYAELAQVMGISVKAAEQLVLRALADLRELTR
jgi:RNA polymerase sigma-70 factor (ECF subfamily)